MLVSKRVHVIARSSAERAEQARICFESGYHAEIYGSYEEFAEISPSQGLVLGEDIGERGGAVALLATIGAAGRWMPVIATGENAHPQHVVAAMRAGAIDYLALPLDPARLTRALDEAAQVASQHASAQNQAIAARAKLDRLTQREREVLELVVMGSSNKMIARDLRISPRTVEIHRAHMMAKLGAQHAAEAIRLLLEANIGGSSRSAPMAA